MFKAHVLEHRIVLSRGLKFLLGIAVNSHRTPVYEIVSSQVPGPLLFDDMNRLTEGSKLGTKNSATKKS